jgi:vitamin B12 transporter
MVFCLTAITISLSAQDSDTTKKLNEVIVSATRTEKNVMDVGRAVTIIKPNDYQNGNFQNLGELLNTVDGIYVNGSQMNAGMNQTVFTRGTNSNHTVVMIDGVRITDPSGVNNAIDLSEISLSNIEQIEIVKGSHSTLYGSSAIGGVINIITRKPENGLQANAVISTGTFGNSTFQHAENAYLNYSKKGWFLGGEIFYQKTNGFDATIDTITNTAITKLFDTDDFSKMDYSFKGGYKNEKTYGYFSYKNTKQLTDADKLFQGTSKYYNAYGNHPEVYYDGNYKLDFNRNLFTYGLQHQFNKNLSLKYYGGYSSISRIGLDDSTEIISGEYDKVRFIGNYEGTVLSNEIQATFKMKGIEITLGGSHYAETMNANTNYVYYSSWTMMYDSISSSLDTILPQSNITSGFIQTELNGSLLNDKLSYLNLSFGMRYNNHNLFGVQYSYQINPFIKPDENSIIYFSYSTGFNAPSLYQLFSPESNYQSGITRGNKSLSAETSVSLELGIKKKLGKDFSFGLSIYSNTIDNTIEYVYLWNKNIGIDSLGNDWMRDDYYGDTYINLGTMKSRGAEISMEAKINDKFSVAGNLSLVSGTIEYSPEMTDTSQTKNHHIQLYSNGEFINQSKSSSILTRRPSTANMILKYSPFKNLFVQLNIQHTDNRYDLFYDGANGPYGALSARPLQSYTLFHLNLMYQHNDHFNFNARIENLTDVKYQQLSGFNTRGRSFFFSVNFKL